MKKLKYTAVVVATIQRTITVEVDAEGDEPDVEAEEQAMVQIDREYGGAAEVNVVDLQLHEEG